VLASSKRHGRLMTVKLLQPVDIPAARGAIVGLAKDGGAAFPVGVVPAAARHGSAGGYLGGAVLQRVAARGEHRSGARQAGDKPSGDFVLSGHCVKLW